MNDRLFIIPEDNGYRAEEARPSAPLASPTPPPPNLPTEEQAIAWVQNITLQNPYMFDIWVTN